MGRYKYEQLKGSFSRETVNAIIEDLKKSNDICADDYDWNTLDIRVKKANRLQRHRFNDTIEKLEDYTNKTPFDYVKFSMDNKKDVILPFAALMKFDKELGSTCYFDFRDWQSYLENDVRKFICENAVEHFSGLSKLEYERPKTVRGIHLLKVSQFSRITSRNRKTVEDWAHKGLISSTKIGSIRHIEIEESIEKLEKM